MQLHRLPHCVHATTIEISSNPWCSMLQELLTHTLNAPQVSIQAE